MDDGQLVFFCKMRDGLFAYVEHGPDLGDAGDVYKRQMCKTVFDLF